MKKWVSAQEIRAADTADLRRYISAQRPIGYTQAKEIREEVSR